MTETAIPHDFPKRLIWNGKGPCCTPLPLPLLSGAQNGELPVLPLSIPGAVTFARLPSGDSSYLSGSDWFVYKVGCLHGRYT